MKKIILLFVALISLAACQKKSPNSFSPEALGEELVALDGSKIALNQILDKHRGSVVLIDVWAAWCPDCIKGFPDLKKIQTDFPEIDYVFLSADKTEQSWKEAIEKYDLEGDHYWITDGMKGNFGKSINLDWIPRYILIDKESNVAMYKAIDTNDEALMSLLKKLNK